MKIDPLKLSIAMANKQFSFARLSEMAGVSRVSLSYINSGKRCKPVTAGKIAKALDVDVTELLED